MTNTETTTDLGDWFQNRPKWLQEAARLLRTKGCLAGKDVDALLVKCLQEVDSEDTTMAAPFPADAFVTGNASALYFCSGMGDRIAS